jgi:hypothetical protein
VPNWQNSTASADDDGTSLFVLNNSKIIQIIYDFKCSSPKKDNSLFSMF